MQAIKKLLSIPKKIILWFLSASLKKKIIAVIVIIIVAIVLFRVLGEKKDNGYVLEKVTRETISQTVSETGNVSIGASTDIVSPSTGIIEEIYVSNGDVINIDDILFKVKSTATKQEQSAAYSTYLAAVSALGTAKATLNSLQATMFTTWDSFRNLAESGTFENDDNSPKTENRVLPEFHISEKTWLAAEAQYKNQQNVVAQTQALTSSTWLLYQATQNAQVKATTDGEVANLSISVGENVTASTETILIISSTSERQFVNVKINEIDIPKIRKGQKAIIDVDAIDNKTFDGKVERVDIVGTNILGVITYNVYIRLIESDPTIRSEMTANVDIQTEIIENILSVPNSSVKPYQGGKAVQILVNGKPEYTPVIIGIKGDTRTEIIEGISEGQEIIVGAKNELIERQSPFGF